MVLSNKRNYNCVPPAVCFAVNATKLRADQLKIRIRWTRMPSPLLLILSPTALFSSLFFFLQSVPPSKFHSLFLVARPEQVDLLANTHVVGVAVCVCFPSDTKLKSRNRVHASCHLIPHTLINEARDHGGWPQV